MALEIGSAYLSILPSTKGFAPELDRQVGAAASKSGATAGAGAGAGIKRGLTPALLGIGSAITAVAGGRFLGSVISESREAARVGRLTEQVIKSTGQAAGVTADHASDLAEKLAGVAGVDDDLIQSGENVLLTFTNVRNGMGKGNDVFDQATGLALDMSQALGTDLQGSILQVGKALNDPIKGVGALSRVGVSFTESQKEQIKTLVATGDQMGAQKIILRELSKEFGGAAAAAADPAAKAEVAWGNLKETLGTAALPVVTQLATVFANDLAPAVTSIVNGFAALPAPVKTGLVGFAGLSIVGAKLGRTLTGVTDAANLLGRGGGGIAKFLVGTTVEGKKTAGVLQHLGGGLKSLGTNSLALAKVTGGKLVAGFQAAGRGLAVLGKLALANPWVVIIAGVVLLTVLIVKNWDTIVSTVSGALDTIGGFLSGFLDDVTGFGEDFLNAIFPDADIDVSDLVLLLVAPFVEIPRLIIEQLTGVDVVDEIVGWLQGVPDGITSFFEGLDFSDLGLLIVAPFVEVPRLIIEEITGVDIVDEIGGWLSGAFSNAVSFVTDVFDDFIAGLDVIWSTINAAASVAWGLFEQVVLTPINELVDFATGVFDNFVLGLGVIWGLITTAAGVAWGLFRDTILNPVKEVVGFATDTFNNFLLGLGVIWGAISTGAGVAWEAIKGVIGGAIDWITGKFDDFKRGLGVISEAVGGVFDTVADAVKGGVNLIIDGLNWLFDKLRDFELPTLDVGPIHLGGGRPFEDLPNNIPHLAKGGVVQSATLALLGEVRPEVVAPLPDLLKLIQTAVRKEIGGGDVVGLTANITPRFVTPVLPDLEAKIHADWVFDAAPNVAPIEAAILDRTRRPDHVTPVASEISAGGGDEITINVNIGDGAFPITVADGDPKKISKELVKALTPELSRSMHEHVRSSLRSRGTLTRR